MVDERGAHFTIAPGPEPYAVRQCPLCTRISPHDHGYMSPHDAQPFCDRCMDDLAALIKDRRETVRALANAGDAIWPVGTLFHGANPPAHGHWARLEHRAYASGTVWRRTS